MESPVQFAFSYDRKKTIQGLRYHFISRPEIRILIVLVNVFAIIAAVLFYTKKIRPEPFLLGSTLWLFLMIAFWYALPLIIYKRAATFRDSFIIWFGNSGVTLENSRGRVEWAWERFQTFFESPNFFHLYFGARSFFLVPKGPVPADDVMELRKLLNERIGKK